MTQAPHFLEVKNMKQYFPIRKGVFKRTVGYVRAVDDVSFFIDDQETLGLVGESDAERLRWEDRAPFAEAYRRKGFLYGTRRGNNA